MRIAEHLIEFLSEKGNMKVPNFGAFILEDVPAQFDAEGKKFLPPAKKVSFKTDYLLHDDSVIRFIAQKENISAEAASAELQKQTDFWKQKLSAGEDLEIAGLGKFYHGESLNFAGNRIEKLTPDYYGLEEIALNDIKKSSQPASVADCTSEDAGNYKMNRGVLWLFLIIIPVAGLIFLAVTQQERIFGKKSFEDLSVKNSTHRIVPKPVVIDSSAIKKADSLRQDSISKAAVPVVRKASAKKSYKYSKNRKYPKKKWTKPKKRVNR